MIVVGTAKPIKETVHTTAPESGFPHGRQFAECMYCGDEIIWSETYLMWNHYSKRTGLTHKCS